MTSIWRAPIRRWTAGQSDAARLPPARQRRRGAGRAVAYRPYRGLRINREHSWKGSMNIYYDPAKFGLGTVGEVDFGGGYDFVKFVIWRDGDGTLYWAEDSGCSCPTPFDDTGMGDLSTGTPAEAHTALDKWAAENDWRRYGDDDDQDPAVVELHGKLADLGRVAA